MARSGRLSMCANIVGSAFFIVVTGTATAMVVMHVGGDFIGATRLRDSGSEFFVVKQEFSVCFVNLSLLLSRSKKFCL